MKICAILCACILLFTLAPVALAGEGELAEVPSASPEMSIEEEPQGTQEPAASEPPLDITPEPEEAPAPTDESMEPSAAEPTPALPPSIEPEETLSPTEPPTPAISSEPSGSPAPSVSPAPSASPAPEQDIIQVAVPNYGQVILNPYGLDVEIDGETTRSPVISRSCPITNLSSIPVTASVRAVGTSPAGSEATFAVTPDNLGPKQVFLYAEFRTESGSWASGYQDAGNQLVITEEPAERADVLSLAPQETGFFRLFGDIQKASQWSSTDSVNVNLVFAFSATRAVIETE